MFTTVILFAFLLFVNQINGRTFHSRQTDSLVVMRDQCAKTPYADECTRVKAQMEDLLRKCSEMVTPVQACSDVRGKYCFIWPRELYCFGSSGDQTTKSPYSYDPDWNLIPYDSNELKSRGDYCVSHQTEQKCRNLLNALKVRYDECSKRPKTDTSCQTFRVSLCAAFPKFSQCLNGGGLKRRVTQLERALQTRQ